MIYLNLTILIFLLVAIQSIMGVGVLVVGTPLLLLFNYNIIEAMAILLPISIITSGLNLMYFKKIKKKLDLKLNKKIKKKFFYICLPFIFIGVLLLKIFKDIVNFEILVAIVILVSVLININKNIAYNFSDKLKKIILALIGIIHGFTNSGGSLLSLFISNQSNKNNSRYNITYFYLFLALSQFLIFIFFFGIDVFHLFEVYMILSISLGVLVGNFFFNFVNEKMFKVIINIICILTSIILLTK